jgi:dimeric dUTPase (all-alpha-NTP-PPase superfamily)
MIGMTADLKTQFEMQAVVDNLIYEKHSISNPWDKKEELILAVFDEICELMNRMRIHKFWSNKGMDAREKMIEEYVDTWHFLLSIGNIIEMPTTHFGIEIRQTFTQQFRSILFTANDIFTPIGWHLFTSQWKGLGHMMGYTEDEVIKAFERKHDINIRRQKNGY